MKNIFTKYTLIARFFPTFLGLIPLFILQYFYLSQIIDLKDLSVNIIGNISFSLILLYFASQSLIRFPSKLVEDKLFNRGLKFPTTEFLMFANTQYSDKFKSKLRKKIKQNFSLDLPSRAEEKKNEKESRKRINEAVSLMRNYVKNGNLLLQHNIEYGFFRNLYGASMLGVLFSVILIYLSKQELLIGISITLFFFYVLYLLSGLRVIKYFANSYANYLIIEYFNKK